MKQAVPILSGLLALQIALAVGINLVERQKAQGPTEKLIKSDLSAVDRIQIQEKQSVLTLEKIDNKWILPDREKFPASTEAVNRLLDRLKDLPKGWPVATTEDAAPKFRVGPNDFEEKITLQTNGKTLETLMIGSAAGYNKVHVRLDSKNEISAVELPSKELSVSTDDWINREVVELPPEEVSIVELPQFTLTRKNKAAEMSYNGKVSILDASTAGEVFEYTCGVNVSDVLGRSNKPEYGLSTPFYSYTLTEKNGKKHTYNFGKIAGSNFYALKQPDGEFYLKVDSWFVDRIKQFDPAALAAKSEQLRALREKADKALIDRMKGVKPVEPTEVTPAK